MRRAPNLHRGVFVLAWLLAMVGGTSGVLVVTGALTVVQLVVWRLDLARFDQLRRPVRRESSPTASVPSYEKVRNAVAGATHSPREFDLVMRAPLQRIASTRLAHRHGIDLHRDPVAARRLLGPDLWELLDPLRSTSTEIAGPGVSRQFLAQTVDRLERL